MSRDKLESFVQSHNDQLHPSRFPTRYGKNPEIFSKVLSQDADYSIKGKVRLAKWFTTIAPKAKTKIVKDVTQLVLGRRTRMCNFLEYKGTPATLSFYPVTDLILGCRYKSGLQTIRFPILRLWNRICR